MEMLALIPASLMGASMVGAFIYFIKLRKEVSGANGLLHFFGIDLYMAKYLSSKGLYYRRRYWQLFLLSIVFAVASVATLYLLSPEFRNEFNW